MQSQNKTVKEMKKSLHDLTNKYVSIMDDIENNLSGVSAGERSAISDIQKIMHSGMKNLNMDKLKDAAKMAQTMQNYGNKNNKS